MTPFEHNPNATMTTQRALASSSSSATSNEDSEESYIDSLEEGRAPLLGDDDEGPLLPCYNENRHDSQEQERSDKKLNYSGNRFPRERHKTIVAICLLFIAAVSNDLVLSYIHEKVPEGKPLPDFVFSNTPYIPQALIISEYLMLSSFGVLIILTFLHKYRWIVLRRIATIGSLLYFGRCITMFVTQVPIADANYYCSPKLEPSERTFLVIAARAMKIVTGVGLKINGKHTLCGDYIYSGHTIVLVVSYLFIREYIPRNWRLLHFASLLTSFAGVVLLLISRGHYTIDVLVSYWICTRIFWQYHTMAGIPVLRESRSPHNHLCKVCWFPIFKYMESGVLRPVPHKYGLPFSWQKCKKRFVNLRLLKFNNN